MTEKEKIAKAPVSRVRRTPVGQRNILTVSGKEPGFQYRFVNDTADRIQEFLDNGWEKVPASDVRVGDKRINSPTNVGTDSVASVGGGQKAYLLRIREDWYKEDQDAKQAQVDASEALMREKALDGNYGKLEISRK